MPPGLLADEQWTPHPAPLPAATSLASTPIHAWALEAKIKAEQAQASQRQWAEKMQAQYVQGQDILKTVHEKPEDSLNKPAVVPGFAFDRLVRQMGLKPASETPRKESGELLSVLATGQTPPAKQQAAPPGTPPKADARVGRADRRSGEKENMPSPTTPNKSTARRARPRGGRRGPQATYQ